MTAAELTYWERYYWLEPWETTVLNEDETRKREADPGAEGKLLALELRAQFERAKAREALGDG